MSITNTSVVVLPEVPAVVAKTVTATAGTTGNNSRIAGPSIVSTNVPTGKEDSTATPTNKSATDKHRRADFVNHLVDAATQVIESIWPAPPPANNCVKLLPLRLFVQEVLRRSRTSYVTLQTALYYLTRVENRAWKSPIGGTKSEEEYSMYDSSSIPDDATLSNIICIEFNDSSNGIATPPSSQRGCSPTTVPDSGYKTASSSHSAQKTESLTQASQSSASTSSNTASDPRQCGRRMFLASLVVATKYLQDRAYSNRAWSRVSGLAASEITRCERKLLQWLNWDLYIPREDFTKWQAELLERVQAVSGNATVTKLTITPPTPTPTLSVTPAPKLSASSPQQATMVAAVKALASIAGHPADCHFSPSVSKDTLMRALSATTNPPHEDRIPITPSTPNPHGTNGFGRAGYASPNLSPLSNVIHPSDGAGRKRLRSIDMIEETLRETLTRRPRTIGLAVPPVTGGPTPDQMISGQ